MAVIKSGNWSFRDPGDDVPDGATIEGGNFSQLTPGTEILSGKTLTINGGNWTNVAQDPAWTVNGGNWTQVSRCAHLHPNWVAKGLPADHPDDCEHVVDTDEVWIDGMLVETIYHYRDTAQ